MNKKNIIWIIIGFIQVIYSILIICDFVFRWLPQLPRLEYAFLGKTYTFLSICDFIIVISNIMLLALGIMLIVILGIKFIQRKYLDYSIPNWIKILLIILNIIYMIAFITYDMKRVNLIGNIAHGYCSLMNGLLFLLELCLFISPSIIIVLSSIISICIKNRYICTKVS